MEYPIPACIMALVRQVLTTFPGPRPSDITRRVTIAIEGNPAWFAEYSRCVNTVGEEEANRGIGRATRRHTRMANTLRRRKATGSNLIKTYTVLR